LVGFSSTAVVLAAIVAPNLTEKAAVEKVLNNYLECRRKGDYKCCSELLTSDYLKRFSTGNKMQYVDFYKSTETQYHDAKAIRFNKVSNGLIEVTVESHSEEPGVLSRDIEIYHIKNISGSWKIDDTSTKESKPVKEIGSDGKWKDVNK
jgi:hypothetical protein